MKISIITVCLNNQDTIEDTIRSVKSQTHQDVEYIVIDGGSQDQTLSVVGRYRQAIDQMVTEPDKGIYDAMNKGIALATGEVIGILNADDLYADDRVLTLVAQAFEDERVDACYGDLLYVSPTDTDQIRRYWKTGPVPTEMTAGWMPPHPSFFVRKRLYANHGGYRTDMTFSADYEFMLKVLFKHRAQCVYLPKVLVKMRTGGASNRSWTNIIRANIEAYHAWQLNDLPISPLAFLRKLAVKIPQHLNRPC